MRRTEPELHYWVCDGCGWEEESKNRPSHWSELQLKRDAYDFQGAAVASANIERDLCQTCTTRVATAINEAMAGEKSPSQKVTKISPQSVDG